MSRLTQALLVALNGGSLLLIALVTSIDVLGRYLLRSPLPAAYELVQLLMGVMVFAGLPVATARREHVTVGLLDGVLSRRVERLRQWFVELASAGFLGVLGVYLALHAARLGRAGESLMLTDIAVAPFVWGMSLATLASALVIVWQALHPASAAARRE